jgi:hypothetical protein
MSCEKTDTAGQPCYFLSLRKLYLGLLLAEQGLYNITLTDFLKDTQLNIH